MDNEIINSITFAIEWLFYSVYQNKFLSIFIFILFHLIKYNIKDINSNYVWLI